MVHDGPGSARTGAEPRGRCGQSRPQVSGETAQPAPGGTWVPCSARGAPVGAEPFRSGELPRDPEFVDRPPTPELGIGNPGVNRRQAVLQRQEA